MVYIGNIPYLCIVIFKRNHATNLRKRNKMTITNKNKTKMDWLVENWLKIWAVGVFIVGVIGIKIMLEISRDKE